MNFEFYETPGAFTRWLFAFMAQRGTPIVGNIFEPCVGEGAIPKAAALRVMEFGVKNRWVTNDIDTARSANFLLDASLEGAWEHAVDEFGAPIDWTVSNPPFTPAIEIVNRALRYSRVGVAMHLRASIHEVLKTGTRRTWMAENTPTGILWLPRFSYQRSPSTGKWTTDSVCACWVVWLNPTNGVQPKQFIAYAPTHVMAQMDTETPEFRARMDRLSGWEGQQKFLQKKMGLPSEQPAEG